MNIWPLLHFAPILCVSFLSDDIGSNSGLSMCHLQQKTIAVRGRKHILWGMQTKDVCIRAFHTIISVLTDFIFLLL